jgi:hypothetical protein
MLEAVRARLLDLGMNPDGNNKSYPKGSGNDFCQKPKNIFASLVALFHKLSEGTEGNLLIDPLELQEVLDEAVADASLGDDGIFWSYEGDHLINRKRTHARTKTTNLPQIKFLRMWMSIKAIK